MRVRLIPILLFCFIFSLSAQNKRVKDKKDYRLALLINVDQLRSDFLFEFEVVSGTFVRGESMQLRIVVCNNMETVFTVRDLFFNGIKLITIVDGEEYVIYPREMNAVPEIYAVELRPGGKYDWIRDFDIPSNAPLGEYILVCPYENITTGFEGYFTLTQ